ncbi:MAG: DUF4405 domain-containing protein [Sedimentisphaerales bacterium]|nr:DUF4405 domain-containing protein [Sedimentisphaerales bacterium]
MRKNTWNFWIDLLILLVFTAEVWTGLLMRFILPPGQGRGRSWTLWNLNRHDFGDIHFYLALAFIILILIHIGLHWAWLCNTTANLFSPNRRRGTIIALTFIIALTALSILSLIWTKSQIQTDNLPPGRGQNRNQQSSQPYRNPSTLKTLHEL